MKNKQFEFSTILVFFIATSILVYLGLINQWFGTPDEGILKFCERGRQGLIKQPANTFSNLAFTFVALYIAWISFKSKPINKNLMTQFSLYPTIYIIGIIITGAGSFAMHATFAHWGGFADLFGMFMISTFLFSYALTRLLKLSNVLFLIIYTLALLIGTYIYLNTKLNFGGLIGGASTYFGVQVFVAICIELYNHYIKKTNIDTKKGYIAIGLLLISFFIWNLSVHRDSILCDPDSLLQGHAVWHILDAIATLFIYKYYMSEQTA